MSLPVLLLAYALAGLVLDFIITYHFRCVGRGQRLMAAATTFVYIALSFAVLGKILLGDQTVASTLAYAAGASVGSLLATNK